MLVITQENKAQFSRFTERLHMNHILKEHPFFLYFLQIYKTHPPLNPDRNICMLYTNQSAWRVSIGYFSVVNAELLQLTYPPKSEYCLLSSVRRDAHSATNMGVAALR